MEGIGFMVLLLEEMRAEEQRMQIRKRHRYIDLCPSLRGYI